MGVHPSTRRSLSRFDLLRLQINRQPMVGIAAFVLQQVQAVGKHQSQVEINMTCSRRW